MFTVCVNLASSVRPFKLTQRDRNEIRVLNDRWERLELPWLLYRYDVGRFVAGHLQGHQGPHQHVLERIAENLPHHASTLRTWASVARAFSQGQFRNLINRRTRTGHRLYWSHFVLLARVSDASTRDRLVEHVFAEDLRTPELRERIRTWEAESWRRVNSMTSADRAATVPFERIADSHSFAEAV